MRRDDDGDRVTREALTADLAAAAARVAFGRPRRLRARANVAP